MPYSGPGDSSLPEKVKGLPDKDRRQWVAIFNSAYATCQRKGGSDCEGAAFRQANGVVLESSLATTDIHNVELLSTGTWFGRGCPTTGCTFDESKLDQIVEAYEATKERFDAPVKLGHDESQKLVQNSGYPAAGWVTNLRRSGNKLLGDFMRVPKTVADIMTAGGYRKRSSELIENFDLAGTTYPLMLTGVALLGANIPAVQDLADIVKLYNQLDLDLENDAHITMFEVPAQENPQPNPNPNPSKEDNDVDEATLRTQLGLEADADILEAIKELQARVKDQDAQTVDKTAMRHLQAELTTAQQKILDADTAHAREVLELNEKLADQEATRSVDLAIAQGRIIPANRDFALSLARRSASDFEKFISTVPGVDLQERGHSAGEKTVEGLEPTPAERKVAEDMGIWNDEYRLQLIRTKAAERGIEVPADLLEPAKKA